MKKSYLAIVGICMFAVACSPAPQPFDAAAAQKEIEALNQVFSDLLSKSDSVGLSEMYTVDAKTLSPNAPAEVGRDKIRSGFGYMIKGGLNKLTLKTNGVWGNSEYVTEEGELTLASADGQVIDNGKYLVLWKKEDGKWKILRDIFNSSNPIK